MFVYIRSVEFTKDVLIRLDYIAKRVDMSRGPIAGIIIIIIMGLNLVVKVGRSTNLF